MPNCAVCQRWVYRISRTVGVNCDGVCSDECAAVILDDEANEAAQVAADAVVDANLTARGER